MEQNQQWQRGNCLITSNINARYAFMLLEDILSNESNDRI
ncbi:hypothetical protein JOE25_001031 [Serratia sp. PL17]|jgi:hypothetical protein|nr:hypothetical protein [Serratia sp. PL17]